MNRPNVSNSDEFEVAVHAACRKFELEWHDDNQYRIEQSLDFMHSIVQKHGAIDSKRLYERILTELIHVEMSLRAGAGEQLTRSSYLNRFPEMENIVEAAWNKLQDADPESELLSNWVAGANYQNNGDLTFDFDPSGHRSIPECLGPFRHVEELGSGGFGVVCKAHDTRSGRQVALKFPHCMSISDEMALQLLAKECQHAESLMHPGIAKVFGLEFFDGYVAMVQQYVPGKNLKESINDRRTLPQIASLVCSIAEALAYSHQIGIIHRDLKPSNILLTAPDAPVIADFGLALHRNEQLFTVAEQCGTPSYMSPQQISGLAKNLDGRSDIWSLGVIFYELLTGQRPFQGITRDELFERIQSGTIKPPREINPNIDKELQRICLKCLQKFMRHRYLTADELVEDLRYWIEGDGKNEHRQEAKINPKGLVSYDRTDANFFVQLLPGTRDRKGLPASLRFWVNRVCAQPGVSDVVPVGVIYGPSGSGKSSFVKAGLIPLVAHAVHTIYVEATREDTEVRLIKELRRAFPAIPAGVALPEMMSGLRARRWQTSEKKILVVLDQFEQWLSRGDDFAKAQLTRALEFCDGEQLQCLVLVRDEYWLAMSRHFDALEYDIVEGGNSQLIDLFDVSHARDVLIKLGQAYGKLPEDSQDLAKEQVVFIKKSIEQLANNGYVVCIHLAVFVEIFLNRDWSLKELESVGGVSGVGVKYLESKFGDESILSRNRGWRKSVEAVLQELLPAANLSIRGSMKSREQLLAAANMRDREPEFDDLIGYLEKDVKLIARADPDVSGSPITDERTAKKQVYYQLTHDYLVHSIRRWLSSELSKSMSGRAGLRLKELAALVVPDEKPKYLPTNIEWLVWQFVLPREKKERNEVVVMNAARKNFWVAFFRYGLLLLALGAVLFVVNQKTQKVNQLFTDLLGLGFSDVPQVVEELVPYRAEVESGLRNIAEDPERPLEQVRRAKMGLVPFLGDVDRSVVDAMIRSESSPEEFEACLQILGNYSLPDAEFLSSILDSPTELQGRRFRCLIAHYRHPQDKSRDWEEYAAMAAFQLSREPAMTQRAWIQLLKPLHPHLVPKFKEMLLKASNENMVRSLTLALSDYLDNESRNAFFATVLENSNKFQFDSICRLFERRQEKSGASDTLRRALTDSDTNSSANFSVALARLGDDGELLKCLNNEYGDAARSYAIVRAGPEGMDFSVLRQIYRSAVDGPEAAQPGQTAVQGLLLSIGLHIPVLFDQESLEWIDQIAKHYCLRSKDPGCFAAAEYLIRKRGDKTYMDYRAQRRKENRQLGNVWINNNLQPFSIIEPTHENQLETAIAVSMYEVSKSELIPSANVDDNSPYVVESLFDVVKYCNRLNVLEGIGEEDSAFTNFEADMNLEILKMDSTKTGYRLLNFSDWKAIQLSGSGVTAFGNQNELGPYFAVSLQNANGPEGELARVGSRFPNRIGLFDSFGNANEIYLQLGQAKTELFAVGGGSKQLVARFSDRKSKLEINHPGGFEPAIRLVRTWIDD